MEVTGDDGSKRSKDDHYWSTDDQVAPGLLLNTSGGHHLSPVEPWQKLDSNQCLIMHVDVYPRSYHF